MHVLRKNLYNFSDTIDTKNNFLKNKDQCVHLTQKSVLLETKIFTPVTLLCHAHSVAQCASFAKILIQEDVWFSRDSIIFDSFAVVCVQFTAIHTKKCKFFLDTKKVEFFPGTFSHAHSVAQCASFAHTSCTNAGAVHCVCPYTSCKTHVCDQLLRYVSHVCHT